MGDTIKQIRKNVNAFLTWWGEELVGMVPGALKNIFLPDEEMTQVTFGKEQTEIVSAEDTKKIFDFSFPKILEASEFRDYMLSEVVHPVTIILSPDLILERSIDLPKAAKNNFRNIVKLQLPRLLPMAQQDIYFDCLSFEKGEQIDVSVAMIKRVLSDHIISVFSGAGLKIKMIRGLSEKGGFFNFINLGKKYKVRERQFITGLIAGLLALTLLFTTIHSFRLSDREAFLSAKMSELSKNARSIEALSIEIQNFDQQQDLYQSKIEYLGLDEILSNLTELLPDDSWVFDFTKNGNRLTVTGKTSNASLLIEKIDNSPLFSNVTNSSTRISNPSGNTVRERFSISFELEEGARDD